MPSDSDYAAMSFVARSKDRGAAALVARTIADEQAESSRQPASKQQRLLALLAKLIEEHAPAKFGPCICELCIEYGQLVGFTYSDTEHDHSDPRLWQSPETD